MLWGGMFPVVGSETVIARTFFVYALIATVTGLGFFYVLLRFGPQAFSDKKLSVLRFLGTLGLVVLLGIVALFSMVRALYVRRELGAFDCARQAIRCIENGQVPALSAVTEDEVRTAIAGFAGSPTGTISSVEMVNDVDSCWLIDAKTEEGAVWRLYVQNERMQGATSTGRFLLDYLWPHYALSFLCRYDLQPWSDDHPYGLVPVDPTELPSSR
jgi:hypothetical protein